MLRLDLDSALALDVDIACDLHLRLLEARQSEKFNRDMDELKTKHGI